MGSLADAEYAFYAATLGLDVAALPSQSMQDLANQFYSAFPSGLPGGGSYPVAPKVGQFIGPDVITATGSSPTALAAGGGAVVGCRISVPKKITVDQIGFAVATLEAAKVAKALLYTSDADGFPYQKVIEGPDQSVAATGVFMNAITPVVLKPGLYYGFILSNTGTTVRFRSHTCPGPTIGDTALVTLVPSGSVSVIAADLGAYAAPNVTLSGWTFPLGGASPYPGVALRRSA